MAAGEAGALEDGVILFEDGWRQIRENGIEKLQRMIQQANERASAERQIHFTNAEYVALYTVVYEMSIQKPPYCHTSHLYEEYGRSITQYLRTVAYPAITRHHKGEMLLTELVLRWNNHQTMMRWMREFFRYLDRFYVKRHSKTPLQEVAVTAFRTLIFEPVRDRATRALLELVERDRDGHAGAAAATAAANQGVDRALVQSAADIYVQMGMGSLAVYEQELERPLLAATEVYYARECDRLLQSESCPSYVGMVERRFADERQRARDCLHAESSTPKVMDVLYQQLLVRHQAELLDREDSGLMTMLREHAEEDLTRLHRVFSNVRSSLVPIAGTVRRFIEGVGAALVTRVNADPAAAATFVEELIGVHDRYHELVRTCFSGSPVFERALSEAFEAVANRPVGKSTTAELLATYADRLLRKGGTRMLEQELQGMLDKVVRLFSYLTDKDLFSEVYRKQLARRLLTGRSASLDAETSMIGKLKLRCGAHYTSKLEGMLNDMQQGEKHSEAFGALGRDLGGVEFRVQVLTDGFWPSYPTDEVKLGPQLVTPVDAFREYYAAATSNRKLSWIHSLGEVTLAGSFERKRIDLVVSTVQAAILLLFNEQEELSIEEVSAHTGLSPDDTKKYLRSLVSGQARVLVKRPAEGYSVKHRIAVNAAFTHQQRRVRIPHVPARSAAAERKSNVAAVEEDRKHSIEATIVRVMKARKTLNHQNLVSEVLQQLTQWFAPDPRQIKRRIEDLIAREYLRRDPDDNAVYVYLA